MDEILITNIRNIGYTFKGSDWTFTEGQRLDRLGVEIDKIYLDQPYLERTNIERYIIEVVTVKESSPVPWRVIQMNADGSVFVLELKI